MQLVGPKPAIVIGRDRSQRFLNGEVHDWYRIMLGYTDHLVADLIDQLGVQPGHRVLDPFCGTGTTLVECMKRGIDSVGVDANPSSVFAARVKTTWRLTTAGLLSSVDRVLQRVGPYLRLKARYRTDPTYEYITASGMLARGWISPEPLRKALALKACILDCHSARSPYRKPLMLALVSTVVRDAANVKFGPELYCGPAKDDAEVVAGFAARVRTMAADLSLVADTRSTARLLEGDSRNLSGLLRHNRAGRFDVLICSPPYPTEHDYTRNARLELAFLEHVTDIASLRSHKQRMIRSHTKNIYVGDRDSRLVSDNPRVKAVTELIRSKVKDQKHGFARYYPRVIGEYFGGMSRHLKSALTVLKPGAQCAYVLGEQASYANVHVPTADILAGIARSHGYVAEVGELRTRQSTTTTTELREQILFLTKPKGD